MTATIVVSYPLMPDRPDERHEVVAGANLAQALMEISPDRWGGLTFELYHGAPTVHGRVPIERAAEFELQDGEVWHVMVCPADPVTMTSVISAVAAVIGSTTAASIIVYLAVTAITMAISYGLSMVIARGRAGDRQGSPADQPSSLNSLAPPSNTMRPLSRVPDVYGHMRHWPDLIFGGVQSWEIWGARWGAETEFRNQKHTTSIQEVSAIYCVGRGLYDLHNVRFGDNGVEAWNGTVTRYVPGQTLPSSVKLPSPVSNISRIEMGESGASNQWTPWFSVPHPFIDEVWAQISWPGGLYVAISGKKVLSPSNMEGCPSNITVEGERLDDAGNVVETWSHTSAFIAQTTNELRHTVKHTLPTQGRWRFRVADTAPPFVGYPNGNSYEANRKSYLEGLVGFAQLTDEDRTFNEETIVIVTASNKGGAATQNLEEFNADVHRILPTHAAGAPGSLTGPVDDQRWITAAINTAMDPKICNYSHEEIDWESLLEVQASLESYPAGWTEENFNGIFDRQQSADEQLQTVARKARAIAFMSGGKLTFARDERRQGVSAVFNRRNRLAERGDIGLGLRFPGPDEYDGVEITYFDETNDYRQATYTYPEGVSLINALSIDLVGATRAYEVCRRARFEYAVQRYRRRSQPLRVTEEAQLLLPYDRVSIVAPWDEGIVDGEVLEVDTGTNEYRLDRPIPIGLPATARIRLRRADGRETSLHNVGTTARGSDWCVITPAPTFPIVVPGHDNQVGTLYNLSRVDAYDKASHWLVSGAEIDDRGVTLALMEDADEVYQMSDDLLDPCTDDPPFAWHITTTTQAGNYDGGSFTFTTPECDTGDILLVVLGSTGPAIDPPAGWTVIRRVDNPTTTLGQERNLLACYRTVTDTEPTTWTFTRSGGTLSGGFMMRLGCNRATGSILFGGFDVQTNARAVGPTFTLPGIDVGHPYSAVISALVAGATIYGDPWPVSTMVAPATWISWSHFSWTPGARPVYAATAFHAKMDDSFTGPTGTMTFTIPSNSNPLNNNLFTTSVFTFYWDPSTGGTLVPKGASGARMADGARGVIEGVSPVNLQQPIGSASNGN